MHGIFTRVTTAFHAFHLVDLLAVASEFEVAWSLLEIEFFLRANPPAFHNAIST